MPEHILSGVKAEVAKKLRSKGLLQKEIAEMLKIDRSMISHYLHGRYPKKKIQEFTDILKNIPPPCGAKIIHALTEDKDLAKILVIEFYGVKLSWDKDKCLFCGSCLVCAALTLEGESINIDYEKCNMCAECIFLCPTRALEFKREKDD
ncbi:4Fe-4S binding protein [Methanocaldococcus sp.]